MNKYVFACIAIGSVLVFGTIAIAADNVPGAGIRNTSHNLSLTGPPGYVESEEQAGLDRICIYCHVPRNAGEFDGSLLHVPLWNRTDTVATVFTAYVSSNDSSGSPQDQSTAIYPAFAPGAVSRLCLSCHDGSIAKNKYGLLLFSSSNSLILNSPKRIGVQNYTSGRAEYGFNTFFSAQHPIGFDYESFANVNDEINPVTAPVAGTLEGGPSTIGELLWHGQMECITCHDVHNLKNGGPKFIWVKDANSELCFICHRKNR